MGVATSPRLIANLFTNPEFIKSATKAVQLGKVVKNPKDLRLLYSAMEKVAQILLREKQKTKNELTTWEAENTQ